MALEPIRCTSCKRPFNPNFVACPFCKAPIEEPAPMSQLSPPNSVVIPAPAPASRRGDGFANEPTTGVKRIPLTVAAKSTTLHHDYAAMADRAAAGAAPEDLLDFSPASVVALDILIDRDWGTEARGPVHALEWKRDEKMRRAVLDLGVYFGEVMRRLWNGLWIEDEKEPLLAELAHVVLPGPVDVLPVRMLVERLALGAGAPMMLTFERLRQEFPPKADLNELKGWLAQAGHFEKKNQFDVALAFYDRALSLGFAGDLKMGIERSRVRVAAALQAAVAEATPPSEKAPPSVKPRPSGPVVLEFAKGADEAAVRLTKGSVLPNHSSASVAAMDAWLHLEWGLDPFPEARVRELARDAWVFGSYVGELMRIRLGGSWRLDAGDPTRSTVEWPSGTSVCPFDFVVGRMTGGAKQTIYSQLEKLRVALVTNKDIPRPDPKVEAKDWLAQGDALAESQANVVIAFQFAKRAIAIDPTFALAHARLGEWKQRAGDEANEAGRHFDAALAADANCLPALLGKARLAERLRRNDEALALLDRVLAQPGDQSTAALAKGRIFLALGLWDDATDAFRRATDGEASGSRAWIGLARCLEHADDVRGAIRAYEAALERDGGIGIAIFRIARLLDETGRHAEALPFYHRYLGSKDTQLDDSLTAQTRIDEIESAPAWLVAEGERRALAGDPKGALVIFERALAKLPDDVEALRERGSCLVALGHLDLALESFERAEGVEPTDVVTRDRHAQALMSAKRYDEARAVVERGLEGVPDAFALWLRHAAVAIATESWKVAKESAARALALAPNDGEASLLAAEALLGSGEESEGRAVLLEVMSGAETEGGEAAALKARRRLWTLAHKDKVLDPKRAHSFRKEAVVRFHEGNTVDGLHLMGEAIAHDPFERAIWVDFGTLLAESGKDDEAVDAFTRGLELAPSDVELLERRASSYVRMGRAEDALRDYERMLVKNRKNLVATRGRVACLRELSRFEEALVALDSASVFAPADPVLLHERAVVVDALKAN
ncbi:MAG: tetratricopeptide repeat protein [Polyangiaceae bacterium]